MVRSITSSSLPLVFLHGVLGNRNDWAQVLSYLPDIRSLCIDLPGHGDAPFAETFEFDPPAEKFHLIGYSMGGRLALDYAQRHPERIAKLLIASAHPGLPTEEEKEKRLKSDAVWAKRLIEWPIDEFLNCWYDQPVFAGFKPDLTMRRNQNIEGLSSALMHYSLGRQPLLKVEKALYVVGERDAKFRALHPDAIVVPNAGHAVHLENASAFATIIKEKIL